MGKIGNCSALILLFLLLVSSGSAYAGKNDGDRGGGFYPNQITSDNRLSFILKHDEDEIGMIDGYTSYGGVLVPITELFEQLNFHTNLKIGRGEVFGWYGDASKWFLIDTIKNEIRIDNKIHKYNSEQVVKTDKNIFTDINFLSTYFSFEFSVDYTNLIISIDSGRKSPVAPAKLRPLKQPESQISKEQREYNLTDIIDSQDLTSETKPSEVKKEIKIEKVVPKEENLMVFEIRVGQLAYDDLLETYFENGRFYIPLSQFFNLVEFAVDVDAEKGTAEGWYVKEDNNFSLNLEEKKVVIQGQEYNFADEGWFTEWDDIFVLSSRIEEWMPIKIEPIFSKQAFVLKPEILLPFQRRRERELKHERWLNTKSEKRNYEKIVPEYSLLQVPFADITLGQSYSKKGNGDEDLSSNYSALLSGDFAALNTKWFVSGDEEDLNNVRFVGSRTDVDGKLFGIPGLSKLEIGDVTAIDQDLTLGSAIGKGISVSSYKIDRPTKFDSTNINGDAKPGWEVELYVNASLVDFKVVGEDGRYEFNDVPIFYGNNIIKLIFYGPQGEVREETKQLDISSAILEKGEFNYRASLNEKNKHLFDIQQNDEHGQSRFSGEVEYGVADNLTVSVGSVYAELEDNTKHTYQTIGAVTTLPLNIVSKFNFANDSSEDGGWAAQFTGHAKVSNIDVRFEQKVLNEFSNEFNENASDREEAFSALSFSGAMKPFKSLPSFSYTLGGRKTDFESGRKTTDINKRLTTAFGGFSFTNTMVAKIDENVSDTNEELDGNFAIRGKYDKTIFRADTSYKLVGDEKKVESAGFSLRRPWSRNLNTQMSLRKDFFGTNTTRLNSSINWNTDHYRLSGNLDADDDENYILGMNLSFSLYREPRSGKFGIGNGVAASSGAVSAIAFIDENSNYIMDGEEEILQNSGFILGGKRKESSDDGIAMLLGLRSDAFNDIALDEGSLDDAFWIPAKEGYSVFGRSGVPALLDIPVIETNEIDGVAWFESGGKATEVSGLKLHLLTSDGKPVKETTTEFDGFYLFDRIPAGDYVIVLSEEQAVELKVELAEPVRIKIDKGSDVYAGYDLTLKRYSGKKRNKHNVGDIASREQKDSAKPKNYRAQLAAYRYENNLKQGWKKLNESYPELFKNKPYMSSKEEFKKGTFYVLFTGPFKTKEEVAEFCNELKQRKHECVIRGI